MKKYFALLLFVGISSSAFARQDCPIAKIEHIQVELGYGLVKLIGQPWRRIGAIADIGTKERLSILLAAQFAGKRVLIAYPDGFDCSKTNFDTAMNVVRTYND